MSNRTELNANEMIARLDTQIRALEILQRRMIALRIKAEASINAD